MTSSPSSPGLHRLQRLRIEHLAQEVVLPDMQPVLRLVAFVGDARPDDLGQAVAVHRLDPELAFEVAPHRFAPRLRAAGGIAQRQPAQVDAHAFRDLGDVERVGRRRAEDARAQVLDQRDLPLGAAARNRHDGQAEALGAVVISEPAGEQAVAEGVVKDVARARAHGRERARHQARPHVEIAARIADHGRLAGRARRAVDPDEFFARHREQAEREIVAQVGLGREREAREVRERLDVLGPGAGGVELAPHGRYGLVGALHRPPQLRELQRREIVARHGLRDRIEHVALAARSAGHAAAVS